MNLEKKLSLLKELEQLRESSTCDRGHAACIITDIDGNILSKGVSDAPRGMPTCDEIGHELHVHDDGTTHCERTIHAEQNAIINLALHHNSENILNHSQPHTIFVTFTPCKRCAGMLANLGIRKVICNNKYQTPGPAEEIFKANRIDLEYITQETEKY